MREYLLLVGFAGFVFKAGDLEFDAIHSEDRYCRLFIFECGARAFVEIRPVGNFWDM